MSFCQESFQWQPPDEPEDHDDDQSESPDVQSSDAGKKRDGLRIKTPPLPALKEVVAATSSQLKM